jgi:hypothetical protein
VDVVAVLAASPQNVSAGTAFNREGERAIIKIFPAEGPVNRRDHYCLPPLERFDLQQIDQCGKSSKENLPYFKYYGRARRSERQNSVKVGGSVTFFVEWHRFAPIFPTADASRTFAMTRENSSVK